MKLIVPLVTPIKSGKIDKWCFRSLIRYIFDYTDIFFLLGTTGEFNKLDENVINEIIEYIPELPVENKPIYIGISAKTAKETMKRFEKVREKMREIDAVVLMPTYIKDYGNLDADIDKKIFLYNNHNLASSLEPRLVEKIVARSGKKIIGLKDSSADANLFNQYREMLGKRELIQGDEEAFLNFYKMAIPQDGLCSGSANFAPQLFRALIDRMVNGKDIENEEVMIKNIHKFYSENKKRGIDIIDSIKEKLIERGYYPINKKVLISF
jgi:dihydrodipicolinate synthase/N-acetylneuraminate lyase